jgi:hypothetical protein
MDGVENFGMVDDGMRMANNTFLCTFIYAVDKTSLLRGIRMPFCQAISSVRPNGDLLPRSPIPLHLESPASTSFQHHLYRHFSSILKSTGGKMGITFDSPISASYTAYDKANKHKPSGIPLPSKPKPKRKSFSSPSSLLSKIHPSFGRRSNSLSSSPVLSPDAQINEETNAPGRVPAKDSSFFRLPRTLREKIYGYILGQDETLHVLLKRKASTNSYVLGHRRCRAGGNRDDCGIANCRQFLDVVNGVYFGSFDRAISLLLACRDMYVQLFPFFVFVIYTYMHWLGFRVQC